MANSVPSAVALVSSDVLSALSYFQDPQWGIVDTSGNYVVIPDTVLSVDFRAEWRTSEYPVEQGGFASYDKVIEPYDVRVTFGVGVGSAVNIGGQLSFRSQFLAALKVAASSLNLYNVLTPEETITNVNIVHYTYSRRAEQGGATLLIVEVWLKWIRDTVQTTETMTQAPSGAAQVNQGTVQPQTPSNQGFAPGPGFN